MILPPRRLVFAGVLLLAAASGAGTASAGDEGEEPPPPATRFVVQCGLGTSCLEGDETAIHLVEGVYLARGGFTIDARNVVLWADPERMKEEAGLLGELAGAALSEGGKKDGGKAPAPPPPSPALPPALAKDVPEDLRTVLGPILHAVYAEGDVRFTLGTRTIRAERLFVDFRGMVLVTGKVQLTLGLGFASRGRTIPLVVRAESMRRASAETLVLEKAEYTTCDFADPHYSFRCSELTVTDHGDHQTFTAYNNVIRIEGIPVFWLPILGGSSELSARPLRRVTATQSSRFGGFGEVLWSDDVGYRGERWGEWRLRTDYRTKRGPGGGPEAKYDWGPYRGELQAYFQKDNGREDHYNDSPVDRDERGRVRWEHRHRLGTEARLDFSLFTFSDRDFQPEYYEKEFLEGRDPETYANLRWRRRQDTANLSAKVRLDEFRTETEELPEAAFRRTGAPLPGLVRFLPLDQAVWSLDLRAGAYQRQYDEATGLRGDRVLREDAVARFEGVKWVGPFAISPIATAGATGRHGLAGPGPDPDEGRGDLAAGVRVRVEARRDFEEVQSRLFMLDGLRHVISLEALGYDRFEVTEGAPASGAVDRIDLLEEVRVGALRLRNRLQTNRGGRTVDWVDLELRALRFPDGLGGQASPLRFKEEGLEEARFQDFLGEEKYRSAPPLRRDGPVEGDLRVRLRESLFLIGEGEYDPDDDALRTSAAGVRWFVVPTISLYAGNRRIRGDSNIWTVTADTFLSDRWAVRFSQQTDYLQDQGLKTEVRLRRVLHDFVLEIGFERDLVTDDTTITLSFVPTALWNPPTSAERLGKLDFEAQRWYR